MAVHRFRLASDASRVQALERADEFKSAILSSVSHDLRSPLTAIKAAVESLRDDGIVWSQHDRASFLETIESQADRLTATVTKLLDMSRLEGRAVRATFEPVEVLPLLGEARAAAAPASAGRTIEIEAPEGLWLRADYHLLLQALGNLIENAARYSNPGGTIRMEGSREGERILLTVADRGPGIPPADLPHIFEKFYRGAKNENSKGTGLGLAIVKAMVELCEGTIEVGSGSGGARFSIDLPAARAPLR